MGSRTDAKNRHSTLNFVGGLATLAGLIAIVANKVVFNKSLIPHSKHAWAGVFVTVVVSGLCCISSCPCFTSQPLFQVGFQIWFGLQKSHKVPVLVESGSRLHSRFGVSVVLVLFGVTTVLGLFSLFDKPDPAENDVTTAVIASAMVVASTACACYMATEGYRAQAVSAGVTGEQPAAGGGEPTHARNSGGAPSRDRSDSPRLRK